MQPSSRITLKNRTGMKMSPQHSKELLESMKHAFEDIAPSPSGDGHAIETMRSDYINDAEPLGTIPPPSSASGMLKSTVKKLAGKQMQVFLDKLAERCAFERSGTRLYEGLIMKCRGEQASGRSGDLLKVVSEERLTEIHDQEAEHFSMLAECIEQLGGDPTSQTPGADLVGVESQGLVQVISDPRTSLVQSLHAALTAELVDNAGWEMLAQMAADMGQEDMSRRFNAAYEQEEQHLETIRGWYTAMTMAESGAA